MSVEQHVTSTGGYAYGVIGGDIHVFGDGSPVYLLQNWRPAPEADPEWLRELPSRMLNSRFEVVPFTGREAELADLRAWRDQGPRLAVRWMHAPGGQGKTRLAARFADETQQTGWRVAAATHGPSSVQPPPGSQNLTTDGHGGVLLIVDYADRWPLTHLTWLFRNAVLHQEGVRARVLLLARTADAWPAIRNSLENQQAGTSSHLLSELPSGSEARAEMYDAARDAFAVRYGVPAVPGPPPPYGLTLALHMAALVSVDAHSHGRRPPTDMAGLTVYLLDREHLHWATLHARGGTYATPRQAMNRAVFAAALTGTLDRPTGSAVVAGLETGLSPGRVLDDHAFCYPAAEPERGTVLEPLYPDRLAEDFLALTLPGHGADYPAMEWAPPTTASLIGPHAERAVTFLASAAQRWPHLGPQHLYPLLTADPGLAVAAGGAALSALAVLDDIPLRLLAAICAVFPDRHVDLDVGMAALMRRTVHTMLTVDDSPTARATGYYHLSTRLLNAGHLDQALVAAERAVAAQQEAPDDVPARAAALARLGRCLGKTGRPTEAVTAIELCVAVFERLVEAEPARWGGDHAGALNDLGAWLSRTDRHHEAPAVGKRAVAAWRRFVSLRPEHEQHLAEALHNLGNYLSAMGRWPEAADATREALTIWLPLAAREPAAYEPDLAGALVNLGNQLSAQGRQSDALLLLRQAVTTLRALARVNAAAHEPDLALALTNLGADLAATGRLPEAVDASAEAVAIRRRLAAGNLAAHSPGLAQSLSLLAGHLLGVDRPAEALVAAEEAVSISERLYAEHPELHRADLARSLSHLGLCLEPAGRSSEGLAAALRAVELYRTAFDGNPAAYTFDLARTLLDLGRFLALDGRWEEALGPLDEAVSLAQRSVAANPPVYGLLLEELHQARAGCLTMLRRGRRPRS